LDILAKVNSIKYIATLTKALKKYSINELEQALSRDGTFLISDDDTEFAVSW